MSTLLTFAMDPGEPLSMNGIELVTKACEAWGVELSRTEYDPKDFKLRRTFSYKGKPLDVVWSPEVAEDLAAFHGMDAQNEIVRVVMDRLIKALLEFEDDAD